MAQPQQASVPIPFPKRDKLKSITQVSDTLCDAFQYIDQDSYNLCVRTQKTKIVALGVTIIIIILGIILFIYPMISTEPYTDLTIMYIGLALIPIGIGCFLLFQQKIKEKSTETIGIMDQFQNQL